MMLQTLLMTAGFCAVIAFVLTSLLMLIGVVLGGHPSLLGFLVGWGMITLPILIVFLVVQGIVSLMSNGLDRAYQASHARYLEDLRARGYTEVQIRDKEDDPGFLTRHMGVIGIVAIVLGVCFFPISLPLAGIYGLHLLWGWRSAKEDVQAYDARFQSSPGSPGRRAP
jgi:hypothetical protein